MEQLSDRERFHRTVRWQPTDRLPLWSDPVPDETWARWCESQSDPKRQIEEAFLFDRYRVHWFHVGPLLPAPLRGKDDDLDRRAQAFSLSAVPNRVNLTPSLQRGEEEVPTGIWVSRGFFQTLGVEDWATLCQVLYALFDQPQKVQKVVENSVQLVLYQLSRMPATETVDFAVINEPIASFHRPVLSPELYRRFCFRPYRLMIDYLMAKGVGLVIVETYGFVEPLIPIWLDLGVGGLWCHHANASGMDYRMVRRRYGRPLILFGGIDSRSLLGGAREIEKAVEQIAPLVKQGGCLPFLDDKVRPNISFDAYRYYRQRLQMIVLSPH